MPTTATAPRSTAQSFPGTAGRGHSAAAARASLRHQRQSFAGRMSHSIATRLSTVGQREPERTGTVAGVTINTLCNVMGAGVLALPLATYNSTVGLGMLLLTYVTLMSAYAVYCLVAACDATSRFSVTEVTAFALFPPRSFDIFCSTEGEKLEGQTAASAVGDPGNPPAASATTTTQFREWRLQHARDELRKRQWRRIVTVVVELIIFCSNYGALAIYARVIADSMPPVMGNLFSQMAVEPIPLLENEVFWLVSSGVIFFFLSCASNMEELKWSSLLGFLTIFYIVVIVAYRFCTASWSTDPAENARGNPSIDPEERGTIRWFGVPVTALRTISAYSLAYGYHFNVPYFYREIQNRVPTEMMKTVAWSFPIISGCYAVTGALGYMTFGDLVASAAAGGNIVRNYGDRDVLVNIGRLGLFIHFACVFPIVSICARRGLHRLLMMALKWREQGALMELLVLELEDEDSQFGPDATSAVNAYAAAATATTTDAAVPDTSERTPLLGRPGEAAEADVPAPAHNPPTLGIDEAELDRDVGSPDDTTRLAIVAEALVLVCTVVTLAGVVSGISLVIDVVGTLFGVFLVLIVPGIVGARIFSRDYILAQAAAQQQHGSSGGGGGAPVDPLTGASVFGDGEQASSSFTSSTAVRFAPLKRALCILSAVTGIAFTIVGTTVFVMDHLPKE